MSHRLALYTVLLLLVVGLLLSVHGCGTEETPAEPEKSKNDITPNPYLSRPYNQVTFLTTHNAMSYFDWGSPSPQHGMCVNQHSSIEDQLEHGVRAFMFDIHWWDEEGALAGEGSSPGPDVPVGEQGPDSPIVDWKIWLCHGNPGAGIHPCLQLVFEPFEVELQHIADFLEGHPTEVITLILEDYVQDEAKVHSVFEGVKFSDKVTSLRDVLYDPDGTDWNLSAKGDWPTLQWMVDHDQRLVVFTDSNVPYAQIPRYSEYLYQNGYDFIGKTVMDCLCDTLAVDDDRLFVMNHFAGPKLMWGEPCPILSGPDNPIDINNMSYVINRFEAGCEGLVHRPPSFLAFDFVDATPVGYTMMDPSAEYYDGPKRAAKYINDELWPEYNGTASEQ